MKLQSLVEYFCFSPNNSLETGLIVSVLHLKGFSDLSEHHLYKPMHLSPFQDLPVWRRASKPLFPPHTPKEGGRGPSHRPVA